jgi:hypothetical protein
MRSWDGELEERLERNCGCLDNIKQTLQSLSALGTLGRSDLTSHLLWYVNEGLRTELQGTFFRRSRLTILTAFAQAAELVQPDDEDGDSVAAIKNRVARSKKSKSRKLILHLLWQQTMMQWRTSQKMRANARKRRAVTVTVAESD